MKIFHKKMQKLFVSAFQIILRQNVALNLHHFHVAHSVAVKKHFRHSVPVEYRSYFLQNHLSYSDQMCIRDRVKNDTVPETEETTVRPIHEDKNKSDNQCEIVVPSETVKPIEPTEPKQDEPKEEIKPQPSHGGHTTSGSRPNNSNQNQDKPSDNNADKPNGDTEINPPIPCLLYTSIIKTKIAKMINNYL